MKRLHKTQKLGMAAVSLDVRTALKIAMLAIPAATLLALAPQLNMESDQELQHILYWIAAVTLAIIGILFIRFLVVSSQNLSFLFKYIYVLDRKPIDFDDAHNAASFVRAHINSQDQYFEMLERIARYQTRRCDHIQSAIERSQDKRNGTSMARFNSERQDLESIHTIMGLI